jgi:TRAP-type mannitol/chloroaromatic compound transport system permease large subunit
MRRELWFGGLMIAGVLVAIVVLMPPADEITNPHLGLLMLSLIVVSIMLGFPTAFTLMGMGVLFTWLAYRSVDPDDAVSLTLYLMVQRAYSVMTNDVLIAVPLFVFMGYLVERARLIERLFHSIHLALAWLPGSLAVASLVTSALFATATGIVGAVVTLMGLLAFPAMLKAGYDVRLSAGTITAGGCLGILIPPSVMLILYGATAGVSVVQLYAGAFLPGLMLALLYAAYVVLVAIVRPHQAPPLAEEARRVELSPALARLGVPADTPALGALARTFARGAQGRGALATNAFLALLPALALVSVLAFAYQRLSMTPAEFESPEGLVSLGYSSQQLETFDGGTGLQEPPGAEPAVSSDPAAVPETEADSEGEPWQFWVAAAVVLVLIVIGYRHFTLAQLQILRILLASFFPLAMLIAAVLGSILFGLATPSEAAAAGAFGGYLLTVAYRLASLPRECRRRVLLQWAPLIAIVVGVFGMALATDWQPPSWTVVVAWLAVAALAVLAYVQLGLAAVLHESVYLSARTTAMVCWLFVGSAIFAAAFALLGGQQLIEEWVLSLDLTPLQFMILAQVVIFLLGWPLEWTEIIVIFMPIFIPLLATFGIDPLFFGLLVALNLQTAFLSPPVAMSAFYLKGVAPPHVTLGQIFRGAVPFMVIQVIAIVLLYLFPEVGLWLPRVLYE